MAGERSVKILHIITRLDRGGSADNTLLSCMGQRKRGHEVTLLTGPGTDPDSPLTPQARKEGVDLIYEPSLVRSIRPFKDVCALWACLRIIRSGNFDMIHTHTSKAGILGRAAARLAGARPVVHTPHGHVFYGYFGNMKTKLFIWAERRMARWTDAIVTLTDREAEEHLAAGVGRPGQFETVFSGIRMDDPAPRRPEEVEGRRDRLGLPPGCDIVVSAGRLEPIKGHGTLIDAFPQVLSRCPDTHLVLAGEGELRAAYEKRAGELKIREKVHFLGWREDVNEILRESALFVMPSINEGMGRAIVEAMAAGLAVVGTRVGGIPLVVEEGVSGLLVPPEDAGALAAAIVRLLSDPAERRAMGEAGKQRAQAFSDEAMTGRLDALYRRLLSPAAEASA